MNTIKVYSKSDIQRIVNEEITRRIPNLRDQIGRDVAGYLKIQKVIDTNPLTDTDSVDELDISTRSAMCLQLANITTVGKLCSLCPADLLKFHNLGKTSFHDIERALALRGRSLK